MGNQLGMTSSKSLFVIFTITCLLLYFTTPENSKELGAYFSKMIGSDQDSEVRYGASPKGTPMESNFVAESVHELREATYECQAQSVGSVSLQKTQGVYAWVDAKGVKTFSDTKPHHIAQEIVVQSKDALDFFDLNVKTPNQNYLLRNQIESRLYAVFRAYSSMLGLNKMQRVQLDIEIIPSKEEYQKVLETLNHVHSDSVGIYSYEQKKAYVLYQGEKQTVKTAIHEAVHAINHTLLGQTPRWLNEGLAEYFEEIKTNMQYAEVIGNTQWTVGGYINSAVVNPLRLFNDTDNWTSENALNLYRSSWALTHFLMEQPYHNRFQALLVAESADPCDVLDERAVNRILKLSDANTRADYLKFTQSEIASHRL